MQYVDDIFLPYLHLIMFYGIVRQRQPYKYMREFGILLKYYILY